MEGFLFLVQSEEKKRQPLFDLDKFFLAYLIPTEWYNGESKNKRLVSELILWYNNFKQWRNNDLLLILQSVQLPNDGQWANDGLLQANDGKMFVNDGEILVNDDFNIISLK